MDQLLVDVVRVGHLLAFAVGLGAAVFLEMTVFNRARLYVGDEELALMEQGHHLVFQALVGLWLTGLALMAIRTGLNAANITPKLMAKLAVVTALTLNAAVIARVAMPVLRSCHGRSLGDLPRRAVLQLGAAGGFSAACWGSSLMLGGVAMFRDMPAETLAAVFIPVLMAGASAGALVVLVLGRREPGLSPVWRTGPAPVRPPAGE